MNRKAIEKEVEWVTSEEVLQAYSILLQQKTGG